MDHGSWICAAASQAKIKSRLQQSVSVFRLSYLLGRPLLIVCCAAETDTPLAEKMLSRNLCHPPGDSFVMVPTVSIACVAAYVRCCLCCRLCEMLLHPRGECTVCCLLKRYREAVSSKYRHTLFRLARLAFSVAITHLMHSDDHRMSAVCLRCIARPIFSSATSWLFGRTDEDSARHQHRLVELMRRHRSDAVLLRVKRPRGWT